MFETAKMSDENKIKAMYEEIFDDPKEFVEYYFSERMVPGRVIISKNSDDDIEAMLSRNAKHLSVCGKTFKADYIYAVAVCEKNRGKGIARKIVNEAVDKAKKEDTWFSYLIPVDERIYIGNGFVTVRKGGEININDINEKVKMETDDMQLDIKIISGRYDISKDEIINELSEFYKNCNSIIYEENIISTFRDEEYFKVMLNQFDAEGSVIFVMYNSRKIVGFAVLNGKIISDYICIPEYTEILFEKIKCITEKELKFKYHPIMVKITSPYFLTLLQSMENREVYIKITDDEKFYRVKGIDGIIEVEEDKNNCKEDIIIMSLKELTEYVFGFKEIDGMIQIQIVEGITVNEEV